MLNINQFKHEFVNCCRDALIRNGVQDMQIIERRVNKPQCGELTGLIFRPHDSYCAPTLYVEQFYPAYLQGQSVYHLSQDAVNVVIDSLGTASMLAAPEFDLKKDTANIRIRMLNLSRNKEFLKGVPYLDTGCGFALIADVTAGEFRANISNELLEALEMSKEELFEKALRDSSETEPAVLYRLTDAVECGPAGCENLLDMRFDERGAGACIDEKSDLSLFVLTNRSTFWGAAVLYYPGVIDKIHSLLMDDYYILPSSVHELIILPAKDADPAKLGEMVRSANETVVSCDEILSDDLYICRSGSVEKVSCGSGSNHKRQPHHL